MYEDRRNAENMITIAGEYCDNTLEFFRKWLKEKYGDLDNLNKSLYTNYSDWKYVMPDRVNAAYCQFHNYFRELNKYGRI